MQASRVVVEWVDCCWGWQRRRPTKRPIRAMRRSLSLARGRVAIVPSIAVDFSSGWNRVGCLASRPIRSRYQTKADLKRSSLSACDCA